jgi:hypothetical protein
MPSFSKECLGGFVGFQGVTIDPNAEVTFLQIFGTVRAPTEPPSPSENP